MTLLDPLEYPENNDIWHPFGATGPGHYIFFLFLYTYIYYVCVVPDLCTYIHTYIKYMFLPHQEIHMAGCRAVMVNETSFPVSRLPL